MNCELIFALLVLLIDIPQRRANRPTNGRIHNMVCYKVFLIALSITCGLAAVNAELQCAYNGVDFSPLQGKSYLKHETVFNTSTDYYLTICGMNALRCNASEFNWPPSQEGDRRKYPMGALLEVLNWSADHGKYKSCRELGLYEDTFASWNKTEAGTSELILQGAAPSNCRIPGTLASTHIQFVCGEVESPDPANITYYLGRYCAFQVIFPTSLACH
jgi:hypothetical protein